MPAITKSNILYLLLAGVIIFLAVFLGTRFGLAVKGGNGSDLTPETLSNQSSVKIGDATPSLNISTLKGEPASLSEAIAGHNTLVGFLTPGCGPCKNLITDWLAEPAPDNADWQTVIVAIGTPEEVAEEFPETIRNRYPIYYCQEDLLNRVCNVNLFPTLMGIDHKGLVRFVASGYSRRISRSFFDKYL
jgi:thiol-disulfide isomerase/thioredoxin